MRSCREPFGADLNHSTISSWVIFAILGPPSGLRSPHAANRFIGLAIGVRTRSCALRSHSCFIHRSECSRLSSWFPWFLAFCSARWCRGLCCGSWAEILYLIDLFSFYFLKLVPQIGECCHGGLLGRSTRYNTRRLQA